MRGALSPLPCRDNCPAGSGGTYVGLAAGYGTLIALARGAISPELRDLFLGALLLTVLVIVRQELVLRENSRLLAEQTRRESEARFGALTAHTADAIALVDRRGTVVQVGPVVERVLGVAPATLVVSPSAVLPMRMTQNGCELWSPTWWRDGRGQAGRVAALGCDRPLAPGRDDRREPARRPLRRSDRADYAGRGARKILEQQLTQVTLHDLLTNLPNRACSMTGWSRPWRAVCDPVAAPRCSSLGWTASGASTSDSGTPRATGCSRSARDGYVPRCGGRHVRPSRRRRVRSVARRRSLGGRSERSRRSDRGRFPRAHLPWRGPAQARR